MNSDGYTYSQVFIALSPGDFGADISLIRARDSNFPRVFKIR